MDRGNETSGGKGASNKSLLEILVVPLSVAVLGFFGERISSGIQQKESERRLEASQIESMTKLAIEHREKDIAILAGVLVTYGRRSVPILMSLLNADAGRSDSNRRIIENSLVQIAKMYDESEHVGRAMQTVLEDEGVLYDVSTHESALRVVGLIDFAKARGLVEKYRPEKAVPNWQRLNGPVRDRFTEVLNRTARAVGAHRI